MKLEQKLNFSVKDLENLSATTLYTGDLPPMGPGGFGSGSGGPKKCSYGLEAPMFKTPMMESSEDGGSFKFSGNKVIIPYGSLGVEGLGDLHDTFNVDRYGNLYGGHTTFKSKFHINTDILKSRDDDIIK